MTETETGRWVGPDVWKWHDPGCTCERCAAHAAEQYRDPGEDGCRHCRDPKTCDECATEKAHDQYIEYLVKMTDEAVSVAATSVANAATNLRELISPSVYYIEMAEGTDGEDALADLAAAARLLRNVQRITREHKRLLKADGR